MSQPLTLAKIPADSPLRVALDERRLSKLLPAFALVSMDEGSVILGGPDHQTATFFLVEGSAQIEQSGLEPTALTTGALFGGLAAGLEHQAFSVLVTKPSIIAQMTAASWQRFCNDESEIAAKLLKGLHPSAQLSSFPDPPLSILHVGDINRKEIEVQVGGAPMHIFKGTQVRKLLPERVDGQLVVAALLDRKAVSLTTQINAPCQVDPLTTGSLDGQRYYRQSQALLMLEAAFQVDPLIQPRLSHSMGFARRVELNQGTSFRSPKDLAAAIDAKMQELTAENVPLVERWYSINEARQLFESRGWTDAALQLGVWRSSVIKMVGYGELLLASPGPLVPSAGLIGSARLIEDEGELFLVYGKEGGRPIQGKAIAPSGEFEAVPATGRFAAVNTYRQTGPAVREQKRWLAAVGIGSVGKFNKSCINGEVSQIIRVSEGFQEKRIGAIADQIAERGDRVKVVAVAGPSSSGKSTFIRRLKVQMQVNGLTPVELSLDDYYCDRENTPKDSKGEYDYEALNALRLDLLTDQLSRITQGEAVQTPRYDFQTGRSITDEGPIIELGSGDVLIVEGIHGLNPMILDSVSTDAAFRIFICPLTQLPFDALTRVHVSDVRLLRRIVRDRFARSAPAADTIMRWPSVQAGERMNIFPYQGNADAVFDSSLIYEIAVLKVYAERYLLEVPRGHNAYTTANRLLHLIGQFVAIYPDHVPRTSLLREFIGGSGFD